VGGRSWSMTAKKGRSKRSMEPLERAEKKKDLRRGNIAGTPVREKVVREHRERVEKTSGPVEKG